MKAARPVMAPVTVQPVRSRRDRRAFIAFPYALYNGCAHWTAPLRRDMARTLNHGNPFLAHGAIAPFIAVDAAGSVVGRIAAIVNGRHLEKHQDGAGFFGFFECVEDYEAAEALFAAAGAWLRRRALTVIRGPVNPSLNESSGLLVEGFDRRPSVLMPYNPPYYERFLLRHGFDRTMTTWAYRVAAADLDTARLERGAALVRQRAPGLHVRKARLRQLEEKARVMCRLYNEAFAETWGHVPLSEGEFLHMARAMRPILDPNLVLFLEHHDRPVGFSLSVPDVNLLLRHVPDGRVWPFGILRLLASRWLGQLREFRVVVLALLPEYRGKGLDSLLILTTIQEGLRRGYVASELSWILDGNRPLRRNLVSLGASIDKEYALFERTLRA